MEQLMDIEKVYEFNELGYCEKSQLIQAKGFNIVYEA